VGTTHLTGLDAGKLEGYKAGKLISREKKKMRATIEDRFT
jgi:hypothetical protein